LYSAFHSIIRTDLKAILAYSTISALGILVFLLGVGTDAALLAAVIFILVHALYKAGLFLVAGVIDHETHSRDVTRLRGLRIIMPSLALAGMLAAVSSAGIPLTFCFIGKEAIYESTLHAAFFPVVLTTLVVVTNVMLLYSGFIAGIKPFVGKLPQAYSKVR